MNNSRSFIINKRMPQKYINKKLIFQNVKEKLRKKKTYFY